MNGRLLVFLTPFLLIACGEWNRSAEAQEAVSKQLSDPASAKFRDLKMVTGANGKVYVCGAVNGRERTGDYGDFRDFVYSVETNEVFLFPARTMTSPRGEIAISRARRELDINAKHRRFCVPG